MPVVSSWIHCLCICDDFMFIFLPPGGRLDIASANDQTTETSESFPVGW